MKFTIRLVGAIWLSVLIVIGGFAFLQIREERERLLDDLKRRAVLVGEGLKEAIEPQVARGSTVGVERILKKFGRPTRGIAVYDRFAGLMVATPEVAKLLPPSLPEVTDAVATNAVSQGFRVVGARPAYVYAAPTPQDKRLAGESVWTEERLKQFVNLRLGGRLLVVVSNREPVSHVRKGGRIQTLTPASGLVTAMDPMMRACGGVWVAHGSGDADRETADARGRLAVPEDDPRYTLRRVWLTAAEERGYYYGFANEGLWPLCHIVQPRPVIRPAD